MKIHRRDFLHHLGLGTVALGARSSCGAADVPASGKRRLERVGVIGGVPKDAGAD